MSESEKYEFGQVLFGKMSPTNRCFEHKRVFAIKWTGFVSTGPLYSVNEATSNKRTELGPML
jgi:hypothetical protein